MRYEFFYQIFYITIIFINEFLHFFVRLFSIYQKLATHKNNSTQNDMNNRKYCIFLNKIRIIN